MPKKMTKEQWISRCIEVHKGKYDYSQVEFVNRDTKVKIICPSHGVFLQTIKEHASCKGCYQCHQEKIRITPEKFLQRAELIHNGKYSYDNLDESELKHVSSIRIFCKTHGWFTQRVGDHLSGNGCQQCGKDVKRLSKDEFVKRSVEIHGDKYDYSSVNYVNSRDKVAIICDLHGVHYQSPHHHLRGVGCPKCYLDKVRVSLSEFLEKANKIHNNKYTYEKIDYVTDRTKLHIICPIHGRFTQRSDYHLKSAGCPKCAYQQRSISFNEFLERANKIHYNTYKYTEPENFSGKTIVSIECPHHGVFSQRASSHLEGTGCPKCRSSKGEQFVTEKLDNLSLSYNKEYSPFGRKRYDFLVHAVSHDILIEYDGEQHFVPASFGSSTESKIQKYEKTVQSDREKNLFAATYNIPLYRIHYKCNVEVAMDTLINHFNSNTPSPGTGVFMCLPGKDNTVEIHDIVDYLMYPDETTP